MFDNLVVFENRYNEINEKLYDPDIVSDQKLYADLMKELKNITPIVEKYKEYQKASKCRASLAKQKQRQKKCWMRAVWIKTFVRW